MLEEAETAWSDRITARWLGKEQLAASGRPRTRFCVTIGDPQD